MGRFLEAIKKGIQKSEAGNKVIVFETTGKIKLATLRGDVVCRGNLFAYKKCPQEILDCVPPEILEFCRKTAPQYLYRIKDENGDIVWESTSSVKI